jgi:hypothetical protein
MVTIFSCSVVAQKMDGDKSLLTRMIYLSRDQLFVNLFQRQGHRTLPIDPASEELPDINKKPGISNAQHQVWYSIPLQERSLNRPSQPYPSTEFGYLFSKNLDRFSCLRISSRSGFSFHDGEGSESCQSNPVSVL